jgi:hypothetical protein
MADKIRIIDVPEVEQEAYDHDRPISGLIQMHLIHLGAAEQGFPPAKRTGINIAMLHTERQAADYIQRVTAMLHPLGKPKKARAQKATTSKKRTQKAKRRPATKKAPVKSGRAKKTTKPRK